MADVFQKIASLRLFFIVLLSAAPAAAQPFVPATPPGPQFFSRYDVHLNAAALFSDDERFSWDTHWGGELDLVDYVRGRLTFIADYQAVLGDEFQPFDPNQGNYTLAGAGSFRIRPATELVFLFNHVSRHLGDRPKRFGIAWNTLVARILKDVRARDTLYSVRAEAGYVVDRAYVDYSSILSVDLQAVRQTRPRFAWFGRLRGELFLVEPDLVGRRTQEGGNIEVGVRIGGTDGVLELFGGYGQVVDADPLDRQPGDWAFAGFRLLNR
jgi:hypothetical protein